VYLGGNGARFINWLDEKWAFSPKACRAASDGELQRRSLDL